MDNIQPPNPLDKFKEKVEKYEEKLSMIQAKKEDRNRTVVLLLLIVAALFIYTSRTYAITPAEKGLAIAMESDKRDTGFKDQTANMKMILRNKQGQESIRNIRLKTLEVKNDGDKSLSIFDSPKDVKGTALLSFTHKTGPDDQWLYLPALRRVKRISSSNKSGPFMGSEFAYEDLSSQEVEKYTYVFLKEDTLNGEPAFVIERDPIDPKSGYSKQHVWLHKEHYYPMKIDFYDRGKKLRKTLTQTEFHQFKNQYWRPGVMEMVNHQTGKSTRLEWTNYKIGIGISASQFNKNALKRIK